MQPLLKNDPKVVGKWRIQGRLGTGGMGVVYFATDSEKKTSSKNDVALKIIREHILEDSSARTRLQREIDSLNAVDSSYVAKIVDSSILGSPAWIATTRVNGPSLSQWVDQQGTLDMTQWLNLAYGLFSALKSIHNVEIIHRDIKPGNILLEEEGKFLIPKLIDFGIATDQESTALTKTGILVGTPAWLAPEQLLGQQLTPSVDLFAVGSALLFAATAKNPWGLQDTSPIGTIIGAISSSTPNLEDLNKDQKRLLSNILQKKPEKRISVDEALSVILEIAKDNSIEIIKLDEFDASKTSSRKIKVRSNNEPKMSKTKFGALASLTIATIGFLLLVFLNKPIIAKVNLTIESSEFLSSCSTKSSLSGLNEVKIFIRENENSEQIYLGQLLEGDRVRSGSCVFDFKFGQFLENKTNYILQIYFPWDTYSESFKFTRQVNGDWAYNLNLKLD